MSETRAELNNSVLMASNRVISAVGTRLSNDGRWTLAAVAMQDKVGELVATWEARGFDLGLGGGIALGYATLGQVGFEGRFHYGAIGSVLNLASRLCDQAQAGQIVVTPRVQAEAGDLAQVEDLGELTLKGFLKPVKALNVVRLNEPQ